MAELINSYLDKIYKVNNLYVLKFDQDITNEEAQNILDSWNRYMEYAGKKDYLFICPPGVDVLYETIGFDKAMTMVAQGKRMARECWVNGCYLKVDEEDYAKPVKCFFKNDKNPFPELNITVDDINGIDWFIYEKPQQDVDPSKNPCLIGD